MQIGGVLEQRNFSKCPYEADAAYNMLSAVGISTRNTNMVNMISNSEQKNNFDNMLNCELCGYRCKLNIQLKFHKYIHLSKGENHITTKEVEMDSVFCREDVTEKTEFAEANVVNYPLLSCNRCNFRCRLSIQLKFHKFSHTNDTIDGNVIKDDQNTGTNYFKKAGKLGLNLKDGDCEMFATSDFVAIDHNLLICNICNYKCSAIIQLNIHKNIRHGNSQGNLYGGAESSKNDDIEKAILNYFLIEPRYSTSEPIAVEERHAIDEVREIPTLQCVETGCDAKLSCDFCDFKCKLSIQMKVHTRKHHDEVECSDLGKEIEKVSINKTDILHCSDVQDKRTGIDDNSLMVTKETLEKERFSPDTENVVNSDDTVLCLNQKFIIKEKKTTPKDDNTNKKNATKNVNGVQNQLKDISDHYYDLCEQADSADVMLLVEKNADRIQEREDSREATKEQIVNENYCGDRANVTAPNHVLDTQDTLQERYNSKPEEIVCSLDIMSLDKWNFRKQRMKSSHGRVESMNGLYESDNCKQTMDLTHDRVDFDVRKLPENLSQNMPSHKEQQNNGFEELVSEKEINRKRKFKSSHRERVKKQKETDNLGSDEMKSPHKYQNVYRDREENINTHIQTDQDLNLQKSNPEWNNSTRNIDSGTDINPPNKPNLPFSCAQCSYRCKFLVELKLHANVHRKKSFTIHPAYIKSKSKESDGEGILNYIIQVQDDEVFNKNAKNVNSKVSNYQPIGISQNPQSFVSPVEESTERSEEEILSHQIANDVVINLENKEKNPITVNVFNGSRVMKTNHLFCSKCNYKCKLSIQLKNHKKNCHKEGIRRMSTKENMSPVIFNEKHLLKNLGNIYEPDAVKKHHLNKKIEKLKKKSKPNDSAQVCCAECNFKCKLNITMLIHSKNLHPKNNTIINHDKLVHSESTVVDCSDITAREFSDKSNELTLNSKIVSDSNLSCSYSKHGAEMTNGIDDHDKNSQHRNELRKYENGHHECTRDKEYCFKVGDHTNDRQKAEDKKKIKIFNAESNTKKEVFLSKNCFVLLTESDELIVKSHKIRRKIERIKNKSNFKSCNSVERIGNVKFSCNKCDFICLYSAQLAVHRNVHIDECSKSLKRPDVKIKRPYVRRKIMEPKKKECLKTAESVTSKDKHIDKENRHIRNDGAKISSTDEIKNVACKKIKRIYLRKKNVEAGKNENLKITQSVTSKSKHCIKRKRNIANDDAKNPNVNGIKKGVSKKVRKVVFKSTQLDTSKSKDIAKGKRHIRKNGKNNSNPDKVMRSIKIVEHTNQNITKFNQSFVKNCIKDEVHVSLDNGQWMPTVQIEEIQNHQKYVPKDNCDTEALRIKENNDLNDASVDIPKTQIVEKYINNEHPIHQQDVQKCPEKEKQVKPDHSEACLKSPNDFVKNITLGNEVGIQKTQSTVLNTDNKKEKNVFPKNKITFYKAGVSVKIPYECDLCSYRCSALFKMQNHMLCHDNYAFYCEFCNFSTHSWYLLRNHNKMHDHNLYRCDLCNFVCKQYYNLSRHMLIHYEHKPYVCSECPFRSAQKICLERHMVIHNDEKPFSCPFCKYKTKDKRSIVRHQMIHDDLKPYSCNLCSYKARRPVSLKMHMDANHFRKLNYLLNYINRV